MRNQTKSMLFWTVSLSLVVVVLSGCGVVLKDDASDSKKATNEESGSGSGAGSGSGVGTGSGSGSGGGSEGGTEVSYEDCQAQQAATADIVKAAYKRSEELTAANKQYFDDALAAQNLTKAGDVVTLSGEGDFMSAKIVVKAPGATAPVELTATQLKEPGIVFEVVSAENTGSNASDDDKFKTNRYLIYLRTTRGDICNGPSAQSDVGSLAGFGVLVSDGTKTSFARPKAEQQVLDTINTCTIDSGGRCDAYAVPSHEFFLTNDLTAFGGIIDVTARQDVVRINNAIVME